MRLALTPRRTELGGRGSLVVLDHELDARVRLDLHCWVRSAVVRCVSAYPSLDTINFGRLRDVVFTLKVPFEGVRIGP